MHVQNKSEGNTFAIEKSFIISRCIQLLNDSVCSCIHVYSCIHEESGSKYEQQGVSPPRLTPLEWGKKHTIVSSSHHEFSNDNGRRQVSCIPLSSSCQYYFYPRIFLSHSRKEFMCEKK